MLPGLPCGRPLNAAASESIFIEPVRNLVLRVGLAFAGPRAEHVRKKALRLGRKCRLELYRRAASQGGIPKGIRRSPQAEVVQMWSKGRACTMEAKVLVRPPYQGVWGRRGTEEQCVTLRRRTGGIQS